MSIKPPPPEINPNLMPGDDDVPASGGTSDVLPALAPELKVKPTYTDLQKGYIFCRNYALYQLQNNFAGKMDAKIKQFAEETYEFVRGMDVFHDKTVKHSGGIFQGTEKINEVYSDALANIIDVNKTINGHISATRDASALGIEGPKLLTIELALEKHLRDNKKLINTAFNHSFQEANRRNLMGAVSEREAAGEPVQRPYTM